MKRFKTVLLYLLAGFYLLMGAAHFLSPAQYHAMMPDWLPMHDALIYASGAAEVLLAVLLLFPRTRAIAARIIIVMLMVFLVLIHVPQSIGYYQTQHPDFVASLVRLPFQGILIAWAWLFIKK